MLTISVLGAFQVSENGKTLPVPPATPRALLALLALHAGRPLSVDAIIDALWGEEPPESARNAVQVHVSSLRRLLGRDVIGSGSGQYWLGPGIGVDATDFEIAVTASLRSQSEPADRATSLRAALDLVRDEPLADVSAPYAAPERTRLTELRLLAAEAWATAEITCGRHDEVALELRTLVAKYPLREPLWALLMTALDRGGHQGPALEAFREIRRILREQLGADPGEQLQRAHREVLGRRRVVAPPVPATAAVPAPRTPLVGRVGDVAEVRKLLAAAARLITIVGPGGVGKTRLAVEVAGAEAESRRLRAEGVAWVALDAVTEPALAPAAVAHRVGVGATGGADIRQALVDALRPRGLMLVLDNVEHLLPAGAGLLGELLDTCTQLTLLVTSRVALRLPGEVRYSLAPLSTESPEESEDMAEATRLLVLRAQAVRRGWAEGADALRCASQLAADLDGLPLALELAAARAAILGPCQLRKRLSSKLLALDAGSSQSGERHGSLQAAITWSYELLPAPAREVLDQLSVFRGAISLDAVAAVTGLAEDDVLDPLSTLVDASLLAPVDTEPPGFRLLETVRAFAAGRLAQRSAEVEARRRHAAFFSELGSLAEPHLWQPEQVSWFDRLQHEHDNLAAALSFLFADGDAPGALRLASALAPYWEARGHLDEGLSWLRRGLAEAAAADAGLRAQAMFLASRLTVQRDDTEHTIELLSESLRLFREVGDARGEIFALAHLGNETTASDPERATRLEEEAVARARSLDDPWFLAMALNNAGFDRVVLGDVGGETEALLKESLAIRRRLDERRGVIVTLSSLAELQLIRGDVEAAAAILDEADRLVGGLNHSELACVTQNLRGFINIARGRAADAAATLRVSLAQARSLSYSWLASDALIGLAGVAGLDGDAARALRFATAAEAALTSGGRRLSALHQRVVDAVHATADSALDQEGRRAILVAAADAGFERVAAEASPGAEA